MTAFFSWQSSRHLFFFFSSFFPSLKFVQLPPSLCWAAYLTTKNAMRRVATSTQLIASHLRASEGVRVRQRIVFLLLLFNVKSYQEVQCCDSTEGSGRTMALCLSLGLVTWAPRGWRSPCSCCCCWPLCCLGQVGPGTLVSLLSEFKQSSALRFPASSPLLPFVRFSFSFGALWERLFDWKSKAPIAHAFKIKKTSPIVKM